ncbi:MAG: hypothetical protein JO045_23400, partial [Mycobacterium sp.]|nr:hypothetical protein [Mycobacterium sp.]
EDILFGHDAVADAAVVGLPDPEWGEVVAAFVRLRPGCTPEVAALEGYCRDHVVSFKVPRYWEFVSEFPLTASGKIQKYVLRDRVLQSRQAAPRAAAADLKDKRRTSPPDR